MTRFSATLVTLVTKFLGLVRFPVTVASLALYRVASRGEASILGSI